MIVAGVDGCKGGWVAIVWNTVTADLHGVFGDRFTDILSCLTAAIRIGVDMPIGLLDSERPCDHAARTFLRSRRSSIFMTPVRAAVFARDYTAASSKNHEATGKKLSKQAWNLVPKIRELDAISDTRLNEVHPEVVFACLAGEPLTERKKTWAGLDRRLRLLASRGLDLEGPLDEAGAVPIDDVVDAAACALGALDVHTGTARRFPAMERGPFIYGAVMKE